MAKPKFYFDLETRSRVDLKKSSAYRYVADPDFRILMLAWAFDDEQVMITTDPEKIRELMGVVKDPDVLKVAHNANFERLCMSSFDGLPEGTYIHPRHWKDTQALAGIHGYPQKLEQLAGWLDGEQKDPAGSALIRLFCVPNSTNRKIPGGGTNPKGSFNQPEDFPEEWEQFKAYCVQDVETLRDVEKNLPEWPSTMERNVEIVSNLVNDRGIHVDVPLARQAKDVGELNGIVQELEIQKITGVANPNSGPQMLKWLGSAGHPLPNLQAETVKTSLAGEISSPEVRRVLELRQELALVAAKKYEAALVRVNKDNRLRGAFQYFGAHTGRWAGRGVQLQNLPRETVGGGKLEGAELDSAILEAVADIMGTGEADAVTLKALVRNMFLGPFTVVDYSAIEARVIAWLAGESWALEAFEDGRDIYVETGKRMGGMSRSEGKVATLALGYNGGVGSLKAMGAEGSDAHLQNLVNQWRSANPSIVQFWKDLDEAFRVGGEAGRLTVERDGETRRINLPSGRSVVYHGVKQRWAENRWGSRSRIVSFKNPAKNGLREDTYGGKLSENVTQAVARDVLGEALVRLAKANYRIVGHVHDEILIEGDSSVEEIEKVMVESPAWAGGLPLAAAGFTCPRYRKG